MTRVFYASTLYGAVSLAAALDAGLFGERRERRLLLVADTTPVPENGNGLTGAEAFEPLSSRFDEIVNWNDVIAPMHPARWSPPAAERPMLTRLIRSRLALDDEITELVVESIAVAPARTIGMLLRDCPVTVYSDGLMSYGPTRDELPVEIGTRVTRLIYLDLVPAVTPLLLREYDVRTQVVPAREFTEAIGKLPAPGNDAGGLPLILGQYLSQLGILDADEECALHADMLHALARAGHRHIAFKPHPAAGGTHVGPLLATAAARGVRLTVVDEPTPVEARLAAARPSLVVSCFSTGLLTAMRHYGIPVASMGTELALERITPYQNSNRIPATIVDALVPRLQPDGSCVAPPPLDLDRLVRAVGFCMQAGRNPELRADAEAHLAQFGPQRYFKKRRLQSLGLLASPRYRSAVALRASGAVRRARRVGRSALAKRAAGAIRAAGVSTVRAP